MNSLKKIIGIVLLLFTLIGSPSSVEAHPYDFYAGGYEYQSPCHEIRVEGSISTAYVIADDCGMAGVEQDITIITDTGKLMFQVTNWYKKGKVTVGVTVYIKRGDKRYEYLHIQKVEAKIGEIYDYQVLIINGNVYTYIFKHYSGELIFQDILRDVGARYISLTASYIEYWRDCDCSFYYYGWVTITNTKYINCNTPDFYSKWKGVPFDGYFIHHTWERNDGSIFYIDKGEIDDR